MADDIRVLKQDEEFVPNDRGQFDTHVRVQFKVGDDGPFFERFPKATFTAHASRLRLEEFARELRALRGPS